MGCVVIPELVSAINGLIFSCPCSPALANAAKTPSPANLVNFGWSALIPGDL